MNKKWKETFLKKIQIYYHVWYWSSEGIAINENKTRIPDTTTVFFWEILIIIIWEKELRNIHTGREKYKSLLFANNKTIYLENLPK